MRNDKSKSIDGIDKAILRLLQNNTEAPVAEIADQVGLTVTPCWRRIQKLEEKGIILEDQKDGKVLWKKKI